MLGKRKVTKCRLSWHSRDQDNYFFDIIKLRFFDQAAKLHLSHVFTKLKMHHFIYVDQFSPVLRKWAVKLDEIIGYGYHGRRANVDHVWKFKRGFCQGGHKYNCLLESVMSFY